MKVHVTTIEEFGVSTEQALVKAVKKMHAAYASDDGCQATLWYGRDENTGRPVCRISFLRLTEDT